MRSNQKRNTAFFNNKRSVIEQKKLIYYLNKKEIRTILDSLFERSWVNYVISDRQIVS